MTRGVVELASPDELEAFPRPDLGAGALVLFVGKKHSGKSTGARLMYQRVLTDRLCIDPTGDADPGADAQLIETPLPGSFPRHWERPSEPRNLHFRADPRSPTFLDDMDSAVALALYPQDRPCVVWIDEAGLLAPSPTATKPNMRLLLMSLRHYGPASALLCCPRPKGIDPLMVTQADLVFIYRLPSRVDRQRLAENMGFPLDRFEAAHAEMLRRGPYWFLLWDSHNDQLWLCPPLPIPPAPRPTETAAA